MFSLDNTVRRTMWINEKVQNFFKNVCVVILYINIVVKSTNRARVSSEPGGQKYIYLLNTIRLRCNWCTAGWSCVQLRTLLAGPMPSSDPTCWSYAQFEPFLLILCPARTLLAGPMPSLDPSCWSYAQFGPFLLILCPARILLADPTPTYHFEPYLLVQCLVRALLACPMPRLDPTCWSYAQFGSHLLS